MRYRFLVVFCFFILVSVFLSSCILEGPSNSNSGVFSSDFLVDDFNVFDDNNWIRLSEYMSFSQLKPDNVFVSNGNLIFMIPQNSTSSGGISSKYRFPRGDFSVSFKSTNNDNSVFDFVLYNSANSVKFFVRFKYELSELSNFVEYGIESSYTNYTSTNYVTPSYSYHEVKISVFNDSVIYYFDNSQIWYLSFDSVPSELYVKILSYLNDSTSYFYDRFIFVDKFSYQKR